MPDPKKKIIRVRDASFTPESTQLHVGRSKKPGEFIKIKLTRRSKDDAASWESHGNQKSAAAIAMFLLYELPAVTVANLFGAVINARADVRDAIAKACATEESPEPETP